jgi:hypothetical protein
LQAGRLRLLLLQAHPEQVAVRGDFGGRSVHLCHILDHEDLGMMAVVQVR